MSIQLSLPAGWARRLVSAREQIEGLDDLLRDRDDAKAAIRQALDRLAERHRIARKDVDHAMLSIDDTLTDLTFDREDDLRRESERWR